MERILFTGARSGIAHAVINKIINKDYFIYVTVHTEKQLELVSKAYKNYNNVVCMKLDITNIDDLKQLESLDIDILVNNAAIGEGGSIAEVSMEKVRNNYEVNVFGTFTVLQIILKNMMRKGKGKIINMSSLAARFPFRFLGVYGSTKASISMLTTTLKRELKLINKNIKFVLIEPGLYYTGFNQVMLNNKYDWMYNKSYFSKELEIIRQNENKIIKLLEQKKLDSIVNKICKAIILEKPKFIYRAPFLQSIGSKLYEFLLN